MKLLDTYTDPAEIRSDFSYYAAPWTLVPREWENENQISGHIRLYNIDNCSIKWAVCLSKQTNRQTNKQVGFYNTGGYERSSSESAIKFASEKCQKYREKKTWSFRIESDLG